MAVYVLQRRRPSGTTLSLPPEELWASAANGIDPYSDDDQGAAIASLIETAQAQERLLRFPPCNIRSTVEFNPNTTDPLRIVGAGKSQSIINWLNDEAGSNGFLLRKGNNLEIEHLWLRGSQQTVDPGENPMERSGIRLEGGHALRHVRVSSFGAAVDIACDHTKLEFPDLQANGCAVRYSSNPVGGLGDHIFMGGYYTNQRRASFEIAASAACINAWFGGNGHIGIAPFGWYRFDDWTPCSGSNGSATLTVPDLPYMDGGPITRFEGARLKGTNIPNGTTISAITGTGPYTITMSLAATGTVTQAVIGERGSPLVGVTLSHHSHEYCVHRRVYDEPGTGTWEFIEDPPAESSTGGAPISGPEWVGKPVGGGSIYVGALLKAHWRDGAGMLGIQGPGASPSLQQVHAEDIKNVTVDEFNALAAAMAGASVTDGTVDYRPFEIIGTPVDGCVSGIVLGRPMPGSLAAQGSAAIASEQVYRGDLLERDPGFYGKVRRSRNTVDSAIVGFAINDFAADKVVCWVHALSAQYGARVRNYTADIIVGGKQLTPDPANRGAVKTYTGAAGEIVVGRALNNLAVASGTALSPGAPSVGDVDVYRG